VLPVPVESDGDLVSLVPCIPEAGLDGTPMPTLKSSGRTLAPCRWATDAVSSSDASSTTTTWIVGSNARISSTTPPIAAVSFHAGTIATTSCLTR